ncbi:ribokinase [Sanguibacter sp. Leaf3]|uniref:ribokinase n=1 Tax=Sanguibacter sp. Leaf3 TaxID=1736209 RepID=UPI000AE86CC8|nr:ribokinase [Sanguibacter sp. Leaf3]
MNQHTRTVPRPEVAGGPPAAHGRTGVVVVGSVNADLLTTVDQHPRPGETVLGRTLDVLPGGKGANQAVAAAQLGAQTALVGAVGSDQFVEPALAGLQAAGVDLGAVTAVEGSTGIAQVTVSADGENAIVVIPGANASVDDVVVDAYAELVGGAAVVVVQGEIPRTGIEAAARHTQGRLVVNLAPVVDVDREVLLAADPLVVNEHEAALVLAMLDASSGLGEAASSGATSSGAEVPDSEATGSATTSDATTGSAPEETEPEETAVETDRDTADDEQRVVDALLAHGVPSVVLTVGARGALVADGSGTTRVPSPRVEAVDTTGAGDAFVGALAYRLSEGDGLVEAARLAARVGAYAVRGSGAQPSYPWAGDPLPEPVAQCAARAASAATSAAQAAVGATRAGADHHEPKDDRR